MKVIVAALVALFATASTIIPKTIYFANEIKSEPAKTQGKSYYETLVQEIHEDAKLVVPDLIQKYGYPCEKHTVVTPDGYILEMHRIPYGKTGPSANRSVVYLNHGLTLSSANWIITGPEKGLAYILADSGYDVWMTNARGTRYSRKHVDLDPDEHTEQFWNFSWHEIGVHDLPTTIDYILAQTNQEDMFFVGHSQGTTVFYVMASEKPEYNNKIKAMFSLAPTAYLTYTISPPFRVAAALVWGTQMLVDLIGMHEFLPYTKLLATVGDLFCSDKSVFQVFCTNSIFAAFGFNQKQMNATLLPMIFGHTPAGSSSKQYIHYAQTINSGEFRHWDYGIMDNMKHYGSTSPPKYELKNVKAPVYLLYSTNDWVCDEKDVNRLHEELGNVQGKFLVQDENFNHLDYLYAIDAHKHLYPKIVELMKMH